MTPPRRHKFPLVEVMWEDSCISAGWQTDLEKVPKVCYTAGYLMHRDKRSLVVALGLNNNRSENYFCDTMTIPASVVRKVRRLK